MRKKKFRKIVQLTKRKAERAGAPVGIRVTTGFNKNTSLYRLTDSTGKSEDIIYIGTRRIMKNLPEIGVLHEYGHLVNGDNDSFTWTEHINLVTCLAIGKRPSESVRVEARAWRWAVKAVGRPLTPVERGFIKHCMRRYNCHVKEKDSAIAKVLAWLQG